MANHPAQHIAIVGAGPGGLTLARLLQIHGIGATVYERERSRHARGQGGSLDLHVDSGQRAMRKAGLEAEFLKIARPESQAFRILDKHGKMVLDWAARPGQMPRPEVDRTALRDVLLDSVRPETVRWDHQLADLTPLSSGRVQLNFKNGQTAEADLVVGADGARSRVRPLLSDAKPMYTGLSFVGTDIALAAQRQPEIARLVGPGRLFALGDGKGILIGLLGNGTIGGYVGLQVPEDWMSASGLSLDQPAQMRAAVLSEFSDWNPALTAIIRHCDEPLTLIQIHMLPVEHRWEHRSGVTLIGDAAHLMSTFAGVGVNFAMLDALGLALALTQSTDVSAAVRRCEEAMFERAATASAIAIANQQRCFSPDGAQFLAKVLSQPQMSTEIQPDPAPLRIYQ
jgi:2-polyprenyl-6-methoxyphenol hydroxylase-like FAD-dependent oxidoreductase